MKSLKLVLFLFFSVSVFGQTSNYRSESKPFIEVIGKAEKEIIPDEIYIDICIKERIEKGKKLTITFLESQLKNELKNVGIPEDNLSISDVNAVLSKIGWWKEEVLSVANYTLKIHGAEKLKELFEKFDMLRISEVSITKATHSKIVSLRKENRIDAIKAAKSKADDLLNAIGEKTGKPLIISEINSSNQNNFANVNLLSSPNNYKLKDISVRGYGVNDKITQFEKIKISSAVYVKFEIE